MPHTPGTACAETQVLLVDDHEMMREALRTLIEAHEGVSVVGEASDGRQAVEAVERLKPDVVVMDIWLPRLSGIAATKEILRREPSTKVVILSQHERRSFVEDALRAGASGYVVKSGSCRQLIEAIESVVRGRSYIAPAVTDHLVGAIAHGGQPRQAGLALLTEREREVLQRIAEGLGSKEIAADLHLSQRTVESHRANLMRKLDVHKVSGLVRVAIREGLVAP